MVFQVSKVTPLPHHNRIEQEEENRAESSKDQCKKRITRNLLGVFRLYYLANKQCSACTTYIGLAKTEKLKYIWREK